MNWFQANLLSFGQVPGDLSCTTSQSWISFVSQYSKNELKKEKKELNFKNNNNYLILKEGNCQPFFKCSTFRL